MTPKPEPKALEAATESARKWLERARKLGFAKIMEKDLLCSRNYFYEKPRKKSVTATTLEEGLEYG